MADGYWADSYWASGYWGSGYWGGLATPTVSADSTGILLHRKKLEGEDWLLAVRDWLEIKVKNK